MDVFLHILQAPTQGVQGSPERVGQELVHPNVEPLKDYLVVRGDSAKNQCRRAINCCIAYCNFYRLFSLGKDLRGDRLFFIDLIISWL
jgi:hypothetical protein